MITAEQDLVHPGDVVDIDIVGHLDEDWRGKLTPEGNLDGFNEFGDPVYGLCRSVSAISDDAARSLSRTLRDPRAVVRIVDRSARIPATVEGAVRTATRFRLLRPVRLRELLVLAGGLTDAASGEIRIFREPGLGCGGPFAAAAAAPATPVSGSRDNDPYTLVIKIGDLLSGKVVADPEIFSGDVVTVSRAEPVYVIGAVNHPRPIYSATPLTVTRAIASAGGLSKDANDSKAYIYRRIDGATRVVEVDIQRLKPGDPGDEVLTRFDILDVPTKGAGKRTYTPVAAAPTGTADGNGQLPLRVVDR